MKSKRVLLLFLFLFGFNEIFSQNLNELQKLVASDAFANDQFGDVVSIRGNRAVVGAKTDDNGTDAGAVYVFDYNGTIWVEVAKLMPSDAFAGDQFGGAADIYGDRIVVGSYMDDDFGSSTGSIYIFDYNGTSWVETTKLLPLDPDSGDEFGKTLAMDGNRIVVSADGDDLGVSSGCVYVFEYDGLNWNQTQKLLASDGLSLDYFGTSVAIDGDFIVVGAMGDDDMGSLSGSVYVFEYNGFIWTEVAKINASDGQTNDYFGASVGISGDYIAVGSRGDDDNGSSAGAAYVFQRNGLDWLQTEKLLANDGAANDLFGFDVAIDNDNIIVGAFQDSDNGISSGSAYLYKLVGNTWLQKFKLLPNVPNNGDKFGRAVFIDGTNAIVGAGYCDGIGATYIFQTEVGVNGKIFGDINLNCNNDQFEVGIENVVGLIIPGNYVVQTNKFGNWQIDSLPPDSYTFLLDTFHTWVPSCLYSQSFTVINSGELIVLPDLGMLNILSCTDPVVSTYMPSIRRCFTDQKVFVQVCNSNAASLPIVNGYVDVELDPLLSPTSSPISYSNIGDNLYRFVLPNDTLFANQCSVFYFNTTVSCDAILGQTLCINANLFPVDSCTLDTIPADLPLDFTPCNLPWDRSNLFVDGWCQNDSVYFIITNVGPLGSGDMDCYSPIRLFIDGQYVLLDSIQLLGGESDTLVFVGDGRTWRMEVDQHPLHPGNSHPNATVELCGNPNNWISDLVNILPMDDADPVIDIYCGLVTGSYDPNDKTGYPLGVTDSHYIVPNGKLEYVIRFQNTGTDTAFTVVILDTLDYDLNIYSVTSGVSSHPYNFTMYGPRVLKWTFNNILLPDSTTDEVGSHGFISFSVNQLPNLPDGTEINNEVGIYFDFNDPVITNETSHIVNRGIGLPNWNNHVNINDTSCHSYLYNSLEYINSGEYFQVRNDSLFTLNLVINENPQVVANVSDSSICLGDAVIFFGSGAQNYNWDNSIIDSVGFVPASSQMYHVIGTDLNGCQNTDSIFVSIYDTTPLAGFSYTNTGLIYYFTDTSSNDVTSWLWTLNGDTVFVVNFANIAFTQNGIYDVCLIASNECFSDTVCQQIQITTVGIDDLNSEQSVKVYPNPSNNYFIIEFNGESNAPFEITDVTGKIVFNGTVNNKRTQVDFSNFSNGIYFLKVSDKTVKLIKQ